MYYPAMKKQRKISKVNNFLSNVLIKLKNLDFKYIRTLQGFVKSNKYARLMRLDKPAGFLLLLLPCLWTIGFAASNLLQKTSLSLLFTLGAIVTRSAGCIINDMFDRNLDRQVERTKDRPLASGEVSMKEAYLLLGYLLTAAFLILLCLPKTAIYVGVISIIPIIIYPLLKRYTYYPQVFLGFVFNLGVIIAWVTISTKPSYNPILIYLAAVLWTIGYDTIYAIQDKEDDLKAGVKSLAIKLGDNSESIIWTMYRISVICLFIVGINTYMNWGFFILMSLAAYHLYWQVETLEVDNPQDAGRKFKSNVQYGLLVLAAIWIGKIKF